MDGGVWILDDGEDNRELARELLVRAGVRAVGFSSPELLLEHAGLGAAPGALVVDAMSASGWEQRIVAAVPSRLVVLTTWPSQRSRWLGFGASRFLLKPYDCESLLDAVTGGAPQFSGILAGRPRSCRRPAA